MLEKRAFFCAHPKKIADMETMTAKMVYWTLVAAEDKLVKDYRKKTGRVRTEKRTATGEFKREKRLRKATMVKDEKSLWFLLRNGYLRLGDQERHYESKRAKPNRKVGECCLCREKTERQRPTIRRAAPVCGGN